MSRKLIVNDGKKERELLLVGTMVVGRDPSCDISEADPLLSRRHVEFVASTREVVVRDLGSRNGILINGTKMTQGILKGGDVIQVGHLQVTFVEDSAAFVPPPDPDLEVEATVRLEPPSPSAAPQSMSGDSATVAIPSRTAEAPTLHTPGPQPTPAVKAEDFDKTVPAARKPEAAEPDKTRFAAPSVPAKPSGPAKSAEPAKLSAPARPAEPAKQPEPAKQSDPAKPAASATPPPAPSSSAKAEDPDKTRFAAPPAPKPAAAPTGTPVAKPPAPKVVKEPPPPAPVAASAHDDPEKTQSLPSPAFKPAQTKAGPVATVTAPKAVEKPATPASAAVVPAVKTPGRVRPTAHVAPSPWPFAVLFRVVALAAVVFLATAIPLILWPESRAAVLALSAVVALVAAWLTSRLIVRQMGALTVLGEDIERDEGGTLDAIDDALGGGKGADDLADAVGHSIAKPPTTAGIEPSPPPSAATAKATTPRVVVTEASSSPGPPPPAAAVTLSARIVTNAQYRVTEASPGCAYLIGVRPDALVGQQLIDAIPDRDIADAVFQALSALGPSGEHRSSVEPGSRGYRVGIVVSREGKDKPLSFELSADREAEA